MRILVAANCFPWPTDTGARIRLATTLAALCDLGELDLFVVLDTDRPDDFRAPPGAGPARVEVVARPTSRYRGAARLAWLGAGSLPSTLAGRDYRLVRESFRAWAAPRYDLVWFSQAEPWLALAPLVDAPAVADLFDLEDRKSLAEAAVPPEGSALDRLRAPLAAARARKDARLWRAIQERLAAAVDTVTVCSEVDRAALAASNGVVVPNGYEEPVEPARRSSPGSPPTVLFQGFLHYAPNVDAATHLARRIAPLVRASAPDLVVRLVGDADEQVQALHDPPRVVVTGRVPDMTAELARADVVAVPVRIASGTRVKILEAFAHGVPVVSTRMGAEGLDVVDGRHLLVADEAGAFAASCARLLADPSLRASLAAAARELFTARYRSAAVRDRVREVATSVAAAPGRRPAPAGRRRW